jgi:NitT/TauT family transport system substrate-binding protein
MFSRLNSLGRFTFILLIVGLVFGGIYFLKPKSSKSTATKSESGSVFDKVSNVFGNDDPDIILGVNTWTGFAPIVWLNGGSLEPNKESRLYKEYGIKLQIKILDVFDDSRNSFKTDAVNVVYCTVDALPVEMGSQSGMVELEAQLFGQVDWSRGGDLIVVRKGINTVADLKGKTIAVAEGTASNTFLIKTLESNGLSMNDVKLVKVSDGIEAAKLFKAGTVDAAVVLTPDDGDCLAAIQGSKVLVSTKVAAYVIADGLVAKKTFINENKETLTKFLEAWLVANGELNTDPSKRDQASSDFAKCFNVDKGFADNGLSNVRLTTIGDNHNFFGLNSTYQGVTGEQLYSRMSIVYSGLKLTNKPLAWRGVSNTSILEGITVSPTGSNEAESDVKFTAVTEEVKAKESISNKKVSINFETASAVLDDDDKAIIDREFVQIAKSFAMARVRIEGNTDAVGNANTNQVLSEKRAQAVANYLVSEHGFDRNKFIVIGNGSRKALNDGVTGASEAYRMTEFQLVAE